MEDAHIHSGNIGPNKNVDVFGVFDGHGGKEVSQYVKIHFVETLENAICIEVKDFNHEA